MGEILIKRVYDPPSREDGLRILVDRLWPRGKRKADLACALWAREVTPTTPLRKAFHDGAVTPEKFAELYRQEIATNPQFPAFAQRVHTALKTGNVTLVTSAVLVDHGHCQTLREALLAAGSPADTLSTPQGHESEQRPVSGA